MKNKELESIKRTDVEIYLVSSENIFFKMYPAKQILKSNIFMFISLLVLHKIHFNFYTTKIRIADHKERNHENKTN